MLLFVDNMSSRFLKSKLLPARTRLLESQSQEELNDDDEENEDEDFDDQLSSHEREEEEEEEPMSLRSPRHRVSDSFFQFPPRGN